MTDLALKAWVGGHRLVAMGAGASEAPPPAPAPAPVAPNSAATGGPVAGGSLPSGSPGPIAEEGTLTTKGAAWLLSLNEMAPLLLALPVMVALGYDACTGRPIPQALELIATAIAGVYFGSRGSGPLRIVGRGSRGGQ